MSPVSPPTSVPSTGSPWRSRVHERSDGGSRSAGSAVEGSSPWSAIARYSGALRSPVSPLRTPVLRTPVSADPRMNTLLERFFDYM
jgi:hypothetical protein